MVFEQILPNFNLAHELNVVIPLVLRTGSKVLEFYHKGCLVHYKDVAQTDPVTQADQIANQMLSQGLRNAFPTDAILAEESQDDLSRMQALRLWCVDPIDGTREFVAHNDEFVLMVGLAIAGRAVLGVVYRPTTEELFWGCNNQAFLRHGDQTTPLRVSTQRNLQQSRATLSRSHYSVDTKRFLDGLGITEHRRIGSVGLKAVSIASGEAEIYASFSRQTSEWDSCAPEAIVRAAGGAFTDLLGRALLYNKKVPITPCGMLASNHLLHQLAVDTVRQLHSENAFWHNT